MTKHVVIAVDATSRSMDPLALGGLLADAAGVGVRLVSVFPYDPLADPDGGELPRLRGEAREILLQLADEAGVHDAEAEVVAGHFAAPELQRITEQSWAGLVVVGSTSRGPVGRLLPGGVGDRLLAGSACPVAVAPRDYARGRPARLRRIGVAFDGSEDSYHAMQAATRLARSPGVELRVFAVFEHVTFGALGTLGTGGISVNELKSAELRKKLDELVATQSEEVAVEGRFLEGDPGDVLSAQSVELDLLVTGSRGYGPRASVLLGSTTHALMRKASCPVLVTPRGLTLELHGSG